MRTLTTIRNLAIDPSNVPPEGRGRLGWVCHDPFTPYWGFTNRPIYAGKTGTPETCKCVDSASEHMNENYQYFWLDWVIILAPGRSLEENIQVLAALGHGARAYCNNWGFEKYKFYPANANMNMEEARQENIIPGGSPVILVPGAVKNTSKGPAWGVLALDRSYPMPKVVDMIRNPLWVCFVGCATIITRTFTKAGVFPSTVIPNLPKTGWLGNRVVDPFDENAAFPTQMSPVPFASWNGEQSEFKASIPNRPGEFMTWHCRMKWVLASRLVHLPDAEFPIRPFVKKVL